MKAIPYYPKVLALGSSMTENALSGTVVIQEKVDGSQFGFGVNEDGEIVMRSHGCALFEDNHAQMFDKAVAYVLSISDRIKKFPKDTYFYCEFLEKPKHNTLKYNHTPKNNLVLFDALMQGKWLERNALFDASSFFDIDLIPQLGWSTMAKVDEIKDLLITQSYLGDEVIEGVVVKNYGQTIFLGGNVFPLFTKYVREEFKERHSVDWKIRSPKGALEEFIIGFKSEARWEKAIIHAKEQGKLEDSPRDIGFLIKFIQQDILDEETENIKNHLFKCFKDDISRTAIKGFPEYYKNKLLERLK